MTGYQSIAAPGLLASYQNVANDMRTAGVHNAIPVVAPTHSPEIGWSFDGSAQYLLTDIIPTSGYSMLIRFNKASANVVEAVCGSSETNALFYIIPSRSGVSRFAYGNTANVLGAAATSGVFGIAGPVAYQNGLSVGALTGTWSATAKPVSIGAAYRFTASFIWDGNVQAFLLSSATLTPTQIEDYSRQMQYCDVNPDWNAWGRRRRWYYAPSALAAMRRRQPDAIRVGSRGVVE